MVINNTNWRKFNRKVIYVYTYKIYIILHTQEIRDGASEVDPADGEVLEVLQLGDGIRNGAREVGELVEHYVLEVREVSYGIWDPAGEVTFDDGELDDAVGGEVAFNTVPRAAVHIGVP